MSDSGRATLVDAMRDSFAISLRTPDGVAEPAALLWIDADSQWKALIPAFKSGGGPIYELGPYAPDVSCGPVIWLKCIVDRTLPEASPDPGLTPVLYLPGVSRQDLRAGDDCPRDLEPLIELQYRGTVWHQRNGRDWTVEAFLTSDDGIGLDIAQDQATRTAMLRALPLLATTPVASLRGRRLEAEDFDQLAIGDSIRDVLLWMSAPEVFERQCDGARWASFKSVCVREFKFDPDSGGPQAAADGLLHGGGKWDDAWRRFYDSPHLYNGVSASLRHAVPRDMLVEPSRRPALNDEQEQLLGKELEAILALPHASACDRVSVLDREHRDRRSWVWAQLGESPFALALEPLTRLAQAAKTPISGSSAEAMLAEYAEHGWRCDRAAINALSCLKQLKETALVTRVVRTLYEPWLDRSARRLQELMSAPDINLGKLVSGVAAERDTCIVFVDGLRFDVGVLLQEKLEARGFRTRLSHRMSPIPTVTATAKPLASPAYIDCYGTEKAEDFAPMIKPSGLPANAARLRDAMGRQGVEVLAPDEARFATGSDSGGWTEVGQIDTLGHSVGPLMISHLESEVDVVLERVAALLDCGWVRVRVVTDHGWVLLPGGLPKVDLPPSLVETKWARCAAVQGESHIPMPAFPWYWNPAMRIASPPGIGAFRAGTEYAHGGMSLQECVIPELVVERGEDVITARVAAVTWRGMRCQILVETNTAGLLVDLRLNSKLPASSIVASTKELGPKSEASLVVSDEHEGAAAAIVVLDVSGRVLDYKTTIVGEKA